MFILMLFVSSKLNLFKVLVKEEEHVGMVTLRPSLEDVAKIWRKHNYKKGLCY